MTSNKENKRMWKFLEDVGFLKGKKLEPVMVDMAHLFRLEQKTRQHDIQEILKFFEMAYEPEEKEELKKRFHIPQLIIGHLKYHREALKTKKDFPERDELLKAIVDTPEIQKAAKELEKLLEGESGGTRGNPSNSGIKPTGKGGSNPPAAANSYKRKFRVSIGKPPKRRKKELKQK